MSTTNFSRAISRVKSFNGGKTLVLKVLIWIHISTLRTSAEMVFETLVSSPFNHMTQPIA
jgi:hypothetical protein